MGSVHVLCDGQGIDSFDIHSNMKNRSLTTKITEGIHTEIVSITDDIPLLYFYEGGAEFRLGPRLKLSLQNGSW
jgi:hypothetical protein